MASTQELQQRIAAVARELAVEELGEVDDSNALRWLDAIETRAVQIADMPAAEVIKQKAALREPEENEATLPAVWQAGPLSRASKKAHFYFVHSYYVIPQDESVIAIEAEYHKPLCAAIARGNLFATQFHPEKSQREGLKLLRSFAKW